MTSISRERVLTERWRPRTSPRSGTRRKTARTFCPQRERHRVRVADVHAAVEEIQLRAPRSWGSRTRACATWASSRIRTGTSSSSIVVTPRSAWARAEPPERYGALPLPTTQDEHRRFTDLAGFDPDAWTGNGRRRSRSRPSLIDLDASGVVRVVESGISIESAPDGIRLEHYQRTTSSSTPWSAGRRSSRRTTPRRGSTGCSCRCRAGSSSRSPSTCAWRTPSRALALLAPPDRGRAGGPLRRRRGVRLRVARPRLLLERRGGDRRAAGREGRVRLGPEPLARDLALRLAPPRVERDAELDWVAAGFGSAKGKVRIQNDLAAPGPRLA